MADIMGAAAGYGMISLVLMLIAAFLTEIHKLKRETLRDTGRVFLCCGLFADAQYGMMVLIRVVLYGMENTSGFMDIVNHPDFSWLYDMPENGSMYAITLSFAFMAVCGCFLFQGLKGAGGKEEADKGLITFYLLPGMGWAFMPGWGFLIALVISVAVFVLMKLVRPVLWKMPGWLYGGFCVLFAMLRCFMLFRWTMGV